METRTLATTAMESSEVPIDRLLRVSGDVYQGMLEHGLLAEGGTVVLVDGLLVDEGTEQLHPISLEVYRAMVAHGLLTSDDKIELLDGLMQHPSTGPHLGDRLGPTTAIVPDDDFEPLNQALEKLGLSLDEPTGRRPKN